jgi:hypothetical protein
MAGTLGDMVARIAAEMRRPDLAFAAATVGNPNGNAIRLAIATAISEYQKQRFRFSDANIDPTVPTFQTVAGRSKYTVADSPVISSMFLIDYIDIQIANTLQALVRGTPNQLHIDIQINNQSGFPSVYAYEDDSLLLYPVPDIAYNMFVGAHINIAAPASDIAVGNVWMNEGELLIRSRAKYEIYKHILRNAPMALAMSPDPEENGETYKAWKSMKAVGNKITGTGRVRPMRF